jgi:glycosyltransferase involved in cell wall biosynthesis
VLLDQITPLILTYNEEANLRCTLERLSWAKQIVVVDSCSTDKTLEILHEFHNVKVLFRKFDHFADQCNFGLEHIQTEWALSLDADYRCPAELPSELTDLTADEFTGYRAAFTYCIYGLPLRGCLYPDRTVLYRTQQARYQRDGHAHRVKVNGNIGKLRTRLLHDDRKPFSVWCEAQWKYAEIEANQLLCSSGERLGWKDRIRRWHVVAPILTFVYCLFYKRLILDGKAGWYYTMQRVYAEWLLGLTLLDRRLQSSTESQRHEPPPTTNPQNSRQVLNELQHTGN